MAELPEQKVHLGRGPRWVVVSWVAKELRKMERGKKLSMGGGSCWTVVERVNGEVGRSMRTVELTVAHIVVEWHIFAARLQGAGVLDHSCIKMVEVFVRNGVLHHYEPVFVEAFYRFLQIA